MARTAISLRQGESSRFFPSTERLGGTGAGSEKPVEALTPRARGQAARPYRVKAGWLEPQSWWTLPVLWEGAMAHI